MTPRIGIGTGIESPTHRGRGLLGQTKQERDRILGAGGSIETDLTKVLIDPILRELDQAGELSNLVFLGAAGAREVVSGSVATIYDWSGDGNDATQSDAAKRFTDTTDPEYNNRVVSSGDGSDDTLTTPAGLGVNTPCTLFCVGAIGGSDEALVTGQNTSDSASVHIFEFSDDWAIYSGNTVSGGVHDTNSHTFSAIFKGAGSTLDVDGTEVLSGDPSSRGIDVLLLQDNASNSRPNSAEGVLWVVFTTSIGSSVLTELRAISNNFYGV